MRQIVKSCDRVVLESDGTEVDDEDYFHTLPPQTVFVVLQKGEDWQLDKSKALESTIQALSNDSAARRELVSQLHQMLHAAQSPEIIQLLSNMTNVLETNIAADTKELDPDWFKDVEERYKRKEDVITDAARRRIRGYYYTAKDFLKNNAKKNQEVADMMKMLLEDFKKRLTENDHYGYYFSRAADTKGSMCNHQGWFKCEGAFNEDVCVKQHVINPYASRSERIVFSTWNLDHQIEKSREVLPCMWEAITGLLEGSRRRRKLNKLYFYELLFTRRNLKLVHVACHDKKEHSDMTCDKAKFYQ